MSLFKSYVEEREGKNILEIPETGFAKYYYKDDFCYIEDIFVIKDLRKSSVAASMADTIMKEAQEKGYKKLLGSVDVTANNPTISLKVLLAYGFLVSGLQGNIIYLTKEI